MIRIKKHIVATFAIAIIGLAIVVPTAEAFGPFGGHGKGQDKIAFLEKKADVLGITVEELQSELENKNFGEIAKDHGVDAKSFGMHIGRGHRYHKGQKAGLAEFLELTPDELGERLQNGETIQSIAEDQGKTLEDFAEIAEEKHTERINALVEEGKISQEKAANIRERFTTFWERFMHHVLNR